MKCPVCDGQMHFHRCGYCTLYYYCEGHPTLWPDTEHIGWVGIQWPLLTPSNRGLAIAECRQVIQHSEWERWKGILDHTAGREATLFGLRLLADWLGDNNWTLQEYALRCRIKEVERLKEAEGRTPLTPN